MDWFFFALLCPAFLGLTTVFYKFLMTKKFKGYFSMVSYLIFVDLVFVVVIGLVNPISLLFPYVLFAVLVGLLPLVQFWFYSKALMVEEVSRIAPLLQLVPIFVVFLSYFFLNESLVGQSYLGIALMVVASVLISYKKTDAGSSISSALKFMMPYIFLVSIDIILSKFLLDYLDYWSLLFWNLVGSFCGVLLLLSFSKPRREFVESVPAVGKRTFFVALVGEGLYFLSQLFWLIAASLGDVSLVSALAGLEPFYVLGIMLFLSLFMPDILKEEISKDVISLKIVSIALMFAGTFLLTV